MSTLSETAFMQFGSCAQADPDAWNPEKGESPRRAQTICKSCPVLEDCLSFARRNPKVQGIWGGLTERQRHPRRSAVDVEVLAQRTARVTVTDDVVRAIRATYDPREMSYQGLGDRFGITASYARRIVKGTSMGHVADEVAA